MAQLYRNRVHNNSGAIKPRYGGWQLPVVGYEASSESYVSETHEQVVQYDSFPGMHDPTRKLYVDNCGGSDNHQLRRPRNPSAQDHRPKKGDKISHGFGKSKVGSAWNKVDHGDHNSPPSRNHFGKNINYNYGSDESDDDDDNEGRKKDTDFVCDENGFCYPKPKPTDDYDKDQKKTAGHGYDLHNYTAPHSTYNPSNYSAPVHNGTSYPSNYSVYVPGNNHTATHPTHPRSKDTYTDNYSSKPTRNDYSPPQPRYETHVQNIKPVYKPLPAIKTKSPDHANKDYPGENMRNSPASAGSQRSPFASSSPRSPYNTSSPKNDRVNREAINSAEARRRYGGDTVGGGAVPPQQGNRIIGSKEAAEKYKGVFVG